MAKKSFRAVTLNDIAMLSHISVASVSAVLNGSKNIRVSAATRERILENARKLNYLPAKVSRALPQRSFIAIWGAGTFVPFWPLADVIKKNLVRHGYDSMLTGFSLRSLELYNQANYSPEELVDMGAKGIIFLANYMSEKLQNINVPYVRFGRYPQDAELYYDKSRTFAALIQHLVEIHNKKNLLFVAIHKDCEPLVAMWQQAAKLAGLGNIADQVVSLWQFGGDADKFFAEVERRKVDAIVAQNDYVAGRLVKAAQQRHFKVPEDLAIVGHDGLSAGNFAPCSLTSGMLPLYESAELVCQMLYDKLAGRPTPEQAVEIKGRLYCGGSCGCPEMPVNHLFTRNSYVMQEMDALENFNAEPDGWLQLD